MKAKPSPRFHKLKIHKPVCKHRPIYLLVEDPIWLYQYHMYLYMVLETHFDFMKSSEMMDALSYKANMFISYVMGEAVIM